MTINIQGYLSILTDYPEDSVLVLREVNLPGWSVMINDELRNWNRLADILACS